MAEASEFAFDSRCMHFNNYCVGFGDGCESPWVNSKGGSFCEFCTKLDETFLEERFNKPGYKRAIRKVSENRDLNFRAAIIAEKLPCALENPLWNGAAWRREFRPISPLPCVLIERPGADIGYFCARCILYEGMAVRKLDFVVPPSVVHPYVRVKFLCIFVDPRYKKYPFHEELKRAWHCREGSVVKYRDSMCEYCEYMSNLLRKGDADKAIAYQDHFHENGTHVGSDLPQGLPRVRGELLNANKKRS